MTRNNEEIVMVFAKVPGAGIAKSRIAATEGKEFAARVYEELLRETARIIAGFPVLIAWTGGDSPTALARFFGKDAVFFQQATGLVEIAKIFIRPHAYPVPGLLVVDADGLNAGFQAQQCQFGAQLVGLAVAAESARLQKISPRRLHLLDAFIAGGSLDVGVRHDDFHFRQQVVEIETRLCWRGYRFNGCLLANLNLAHVLFSRQ